MLSLVRIIQPPPCSQEAPTPRVLRMVVDTTSVDSPVLVAQVPSEFSASISATPALPTPSSQSSRFASVRINSLVTVPCFDCSHHRRHPLLALLLRLCRTKRPPHLHQHPQHPQDSAQPVCPTPPSTYSHLPRVQLRMHGKLACNHVVSFILAVCSAASGRRVRPKVAPEPPTPGRYLLRSATKAKK